MFHAPNSVSVGMVLPAISLYAVSISLTAIVKSHAFVILHGNGPVASTEYIVHITSGHVKPIAAPVIGLAQTSPLITEEGTSVIAVFDNIAKLLDDKRSTVAGTAAKVVVNQIKLNINKIDDIIIIKLFLKFFIRLC
jgi:hypothetical protein